MKYRRLGRTNLKVSTIGLGSGGHSSLGQSQGMSHVEAARLVRHAMDMGINLIDTAPRYGESELILGKALRGIPRDKVILATKFAPDLKDIVRSGTVSDSLHRSLRRLAVEHVDLLQFHAVRPQDYARTMEQFLPEALSLREQGKFRFLGITEHMLTDGNHKMLQMALADDHFDTVMLGYNMLSPSAERLVLPQCQQRDVGVLVMWAVRRALAKPKELEEAIRQLKGTGLLAPDALPDVGPLDWLLRGEVDSIPAAAYKFASNHPAVSSVLTGTADPAHLEANARAVLGSPLPEKDRDRLIELFGHLEQSVGN